MKVAGDNRYGHRDRTMILLAYRPGLRAAELVALRWDSIDLAAGRRAAECNLRNRFLDAQNVEVADESSQVSCCGCSARC